MQAFIGKKLLSSIKPDSKPYEVRDTKVKGFLLRVQPSGVMSYVVEYARAKRITLGRTSILTPAQARDRAIEILADALKGIDPQAQRKAKKAHTFIGYLDLEYGPWVRTNRKDGAATVARLHSCFAEFHQKQLAEINPWIVEKWRAARLKAGTRPATVNRDLAALKAALSQAVEWGLLSEHPITRVKPAKIDNRGKVRYLSDDEEQRLRNALDAREERLRTERDSANQWRAQRGYDQMPDLRKMAYADHLKPLVLLSLNTGLRRGELFSLTWANVDLERANLTISGTTAKSGKTRHIPLNTEALAVLKGWYEQATSHDGLVFPAHNGGKLDNVNTSWANVLKQADIKAFRWHDMRHHFASRLVMSGVDLNTVRELLGHSDITMTLRYAHLAPEHKAAAVALLTKPAPNREMKQFGVLES